MSRQLDHDHLFQVARTFQHGPGRLRRKRKDAKRPGIRVQVSRERVGTREDHVHVALKIGLLRAITLSCRDADVAVEDLETTTHDEAFVVTVHESSTTIRNRAIHVVSECLRLGTWRGFAARPGDEDAPWLKARTLRSSDEDTVRLPRLPQAACYRGLRAGAERVNGTPISRSILESRS